MKEQFKKLQRKYERVLPAASQCMVWVVVWGQRTWEGILVDSLVQFVCVVFEWMIL
jgi:hypothetical protein